MRYRLTPILVPAALLSLVVIPPAHAAYVDPGSGAFLMQALLAGALGTVFYFRRALGRLLGFRNPKSVAPAASPPAETEPDA